MPEDACSAGVDRRRLTGCFDQQTKIQTFGLETERCLRIFQMAVELDNDKSLGSTPWFSSQWTIKQE